MTQIIAAVQSEIQDAIAKHLPSQVGEVLRSELDQLAKLRTELFNERTKSKDYLAKLTEAKATLENISDREIKVAARESLVTDREKAVLDIEHKHALLQKDVEVQKIITQNMREMVGLIFASPTFRTVQTGSVPISVPGSSGGNGYSPSAGYVTNHPTSMTTDVKSI